MKSESKEKKHKVRSLDNIIFPILMTICIFFILLAVLIMDEELLDSWDKFFGSFVLGW